MSDLVEVAGCSKCGFKIIRDYRPRPHSLFRSEAQFHHIEPELSLQGAIGEWFSKFTKLEEPHSHRSL